jgi:manganese transport protein
MVPAFIVVALGVDATQALVISQVVLSIALPVPMIALVMFTRRADSMGRCARPRSRFDTGRPKISLSGAERYPRRG